MTSKYGSAEILKGYSEECFQYFQDDLDKGSEDPNKLLVYWFNQFKGGVIFYVKPKDFDEYLKLLFEEWINELTECSDRISKEIELLKEHAERKFSKSTHPSASKRMFLHINKRPLLLLRYNQLSIEFLTRYKNKDFGEEERIAFIDCGLLYNEKYCDLNKFHEQPAKINKAAVVKKAPQPSALIQTPKLIKLACINPEQQKQIIQLIHTSLNKKCFDVEYDLFESHFIDNGTVQKKIVWLKGFAELRALIDELKHLTVVFTDEPNKLIYNHFYLKKDNQLFNMGSLETATSKEIYWKIRNKNIKHPIIDLLNKI